MNIYFCEKKTKKITRLFNIERISFRLIQGIIENAFSEKKGYLICAESLSDAKSSVNKHGDFLAPYMQEVTIKNYRCKVHIAGEIELSAITRNNIYKIEKQNREL